MKRLQKGQALVTLIFFVVIGISIITAATMVLYANSLSTTTTDQGQIAYYNAESGAEDAVLRLLRNPVYSGTYQALPSAEGLVTVSISGGTVISTGVSGNTVRRIRVQTIYANGKFTISSWKEIN